MLLAELSVNPAAAGANTAAVRAVVSNVIFLAGCFGLVIIVLVLSSTILPSWNVLLVLALVVLLATLLLRRVFIRLHARAQVALAETFAQTPPQRHQDAMASLPSLLREAELRMISIGEDAESAGKMISELKLRTRTGASIVGIERSGTNLVNPRADEELHRGDNVLIIGTAGQLIAAETVLTAGPDATRSDVADIVCD